MEKLPRLPRLLMTSFYRDGDFGDFGPVSPTNTWHGDEEDKDGVDDSV